MVQITIPLLVAVLGCLAYALSSNAKAAELGRLAFFCGVLVTLYVLAGERVLLR
jgi:hypothetical protein